MKLKKALLVIFCALFFATCAFFSLGIFIPGASNAAEGAGKAPSFIVDGHINRNVGNEFETWFSKSFAYRGKVVSLFSAFKAEVFGTGNDQVVVGKDGFLFFKDTVNSYTSVEPMTDEEISDAANALLNLEKYAEEHGAKFIFAAAPNKATVYSDKMPDRYVRNEGGTDLDRLYKELDDKGVEYIDLRPLLREASEKELVYHKRDTHWNGLGAYKAFSAIGERMGFDVPDFGQVIYTEDFEGDLDSLLYPGETKYDEDYVFDYTDRYIFTSSYTNEMNMSISSRGAGKGKVLIFRDSFANALIPMVSSTFAESQFERANPYKIDLLQKYEADYVIVLIAERNISTLIGADGRISD